MNRTRWIGSVSAAAFAVSLSVWALAADKKDAKDNPPNIVGEISALEAGYKYTDPNDDSVVLLQGTKVEVRPMGKVKKGSNRENHPFVVMDKTTQVSFETGDKELKVGQYAKIWFDDGSRDPSKQGLATKIVVAEAPKKKK